MASITNQQIKDALQRCDQVLSQTEALKSILITALQQGNNLNYDELHVFPSRPMTKSELASLAGVSSRTLAKWLKPLQSRLREMGVSNTAKLLPPDAVHFVCEHLNITSDEKNEGGN